MKKYNEIISSFLGVTGISLSVQDLNQIVNLILLILSILNILWILGIRIKEHIKNKKYDEVPKEIEKAKNELEKLKK